MRWMDSTNHLLPISSSNPSLHHKCTSYTSSPWYPCAIFISIYYKILCFLISWPSVHRTVKTISQEPFERNLSNLSQMTFETGMLVVKGHCNLILIARDIQSGMPGGFFFICHKHPLGVRNNLLRIWWTIKITMTSQSRIFVHKNTI